MCVCVCVCVCVYKHPRVSLFVEMDCMSSSVNGGSWIRKLQGCFTAFGWNNPLVKCQDLRSCNGSQLQGMLRNGAERKIMSDWHQEMATKPKLSLLNTIFDLGLTQRCWRVQDRVTHSMLMKLRGGTAHLQVETGR